MKLETLQGTSLIDIKEKYKNNATSLTAIICVMGSKIIAEKFDKKFNTSNLSKNLIYTPILDTSDSLATLSVSIDNITY